MPSKTLRNAAAPASSAQPFEVAQTVGHQLALVMNSMRRVLEARMICHGMTEAQWKPLWMLSTGRAGTSLELAREMGIDAGATTRLVDRLEAKGLVSRLRSESDRRVVHLQLTAAGMAAAAQIPPVVLALNQDFLRGFTDDEINQLKHLIQRMHGNGLALVPQEAAASQWRQQP